MSGIGLKPAAEKAIGKALLPSADKSALRAILGAVDWATLASLPGWETTQEDLAAVAGMSARYFRACCDHVVGHGWLIVWRPAGQGNRYAYQLMPGGGPGRDCDCPGRRVGRAMSDAERQARRRAKKRNENVTPDIREPEQERDDDRTTKVTKARSGAGNTTESSTTDRSDTSRLLPGEYREAGSVTDFEVGSHRNVSGLLGWSEHRGPRDSCGLPHPEGSAGWTAQRDAAWLAGDRSALLRCGGCGGPLHGDLVVAGRHPACGP